MRVVDFHTHAFPDLLAPRAIRALEERSGVKAETDGTVAGLLRLMDANGVQAAVLHSIATKKEQVDAIVTWSVSVQSDRVVPFASIHPDAPDPAAAVGRIADAGIKGIKLHSLYQSFAVDDPRMFPLYETIAERKLVLLMHAGYDIAFDREDVASPTRLESVVANFPRLKLVLAHLGGWNWLDGVIERLIGKDVWIDTSYSVGCCTDRQRDRILSGHSMDRILFGSDSPWGKMGEHVRYVASFPISDEAKEKIFSRNADALLSA